MAALRKDLALDPYLIRGLRNRLLKRFQMLDQVLQAGKILTSEQRRLHNIVFMGMGEPRRICEPDRSGDVVLGIQEA